MFSYTRLLELAGRPRLIMERMTPDEAGRIFALQGVDVAGMSDAELKAAYRALAMKVHPDRGGDVKIAQEVNAAYDLLKTGARPGVGSSASDPFSYSQAGSQGKPMSTRERAQQRAEAGQPDFRRLEDIELYFETEAAGADRGSLSKWTLMGYDGAFTRAQVTVRANRAMFSKMAEIMVIWQTKGGNSYNCRAVFAVDNHDPMKTLNVIWCDGIDLDPPLEIPGEEDDYGNVPWIYNDQRAMRRLPSILDAEMAKRGGAR
jgi:hypothetical protein